MPRLRQNDSDRAVDMVQAGMTHHAVAHHFNVSRMTISRLMIRFRQTGRTNDRPVTACRVWRHNVKTNFFLYNLRLIDLRNSMIIAEDTACGTPGLENVRIYGQTVRRRLREARRPVIWPILKQRHRPRARRRWRLDILFSDESRF
jgi:hypothetical protein